MDTSDQLSAYAPIRMRGLTYWQWARLAAREGRITPDGRIDAYLYADLRAQLIHPFMAAVGEEAAKSPETAAATGDILAKVLVIEDWVPLIGQYELCGRQIFDEHDKLTELLLQTDLGECTLEDLHLPYDAFYVRYGKQSTIKLPFEQDAFEYVDGAFVAIAPWPEGGRRLKVGFSTVHEDGSGVMYPGYFFDLLPDELKLPVPKAIEAAMSRRNSKLAVSDDDTESSMALKESMQYEVANSADVLTQAASLLVNTLFYIESIRSSLPELSPGRDTPPNLHAKWLQARPEKRYKQQSALTADGYAVVRLIGTEAADVGGTGGAHGDDVHGAARRVHWRRGHWRFQRYGAQRALRKRIWIKPVLVGGDPSTAAPEGLPGHRYVLPSSSVTH